MNPEHEFESKLIESFSKHVRSYDKNAHLQKSMAERLAVLLPDPLPKSILEIGCGTGIFTRHLLARGCEELIVNDIAQAMMDHLKSHLPLPKKKRFLPGNAEKMEFPKVNLIVANAVFQWFQDMEQTLKHFHQALAKEGNLIFSTFGPETLKDFREVGNMRAPAHLHSQKKWKSLLHRNGFQLKTLESETRQVFFADTRQLLKNLQQIGAAPFQVLKAGELRRLIRTYDENFTTPQGVYTTWELLYIAAVKK